MIRGTDRVSLGVIAPVRLSISIIAQQKALNGAFEDLWIVFVEDHHEGTAANLL